MAYVLCIYICSLSRNKKSSRVFQNNMVSEPMAIRAEAAAERDGGERGVLLAALAPPLRDAEEERAALGGASRRRGRRSGQPRRRWRTSRGRVETGGSGRGEVGHSRSGWVLGTPRGWPQP